MAGTSAGGRRFQRTATVRRRATAASLGVLLGAFTIVGVTAALPSHETQTLSPTGAAVTSLLGTPAPTSSRSSVTPNSPSTQAPATASAPRRIRTRQS
jgi:hypothetical protein